VCLPGSLPHSLYIHSFLSPVSKLVYMPVPGAADFVAEAVGLRCQPNIFIFVNPVRLRE
jgi:hypothetical protein